MPNRSPLRDLFVKEYLKDLNATQSAIRAGYSKKTAYSAGQRLLKRVDVIAALAKAQQKRFDKLDTSVERIGQEIALCAYSNMDDFTKVEGGKRVLDTANLTRDQMAAVQEFTEDATGGSNDGERKLVMRTRLKLIDKVKALELLGRHRSMFTDKIQVEGTILTEVTERMRAAAKRVK